MHRLLLIAAATAAATIATTPSGAQNFASGGFGSNYGSTRIHVLKGNPPGSNHRGGRFGGDFGGGHSRHIHVGDGGFDGGYYSAGYNDYGDYDANRSFDPDKWNDWWHDRPDRAFPRWMSRNQDCARRWYSGDTLTC